MCAFRSLEKAHAKGIQNCGLRRQLQYRQCVRPGGYGDHQWLLATYFFQTQRFRSFLFAEKCSSSCAMRGQLMTFRKVA